MPATYAWSWADVRGGKPAQSVSVTPATPEMVEAYTREDSTRAVARIFNSHASVISRRLRAANVVMRPRGRPRKAAP